MPGAIMYVVGSKLDKGQAGRKVTIEEGKELAARHGCGWCEVSSKTRENVRRPFVEIVDEIVKKPELLKGGRKSTSAVSLRYDDEPGWCSC